MFFLNGTVLPAAWKTQTQIRPWPGIKYGNPLEHLHGDEVTIILIALSLLGCLFLRNSNEIICNFKPKWYYAFFTTLLLFITILNIDKTKIFLYFNF
jgi:hypothetical protein